MNTIERLIQIDHEEGSHLAALNALRVERQVIMAKQFELPGPELLFDRNLQSICWNTGSIRLGEKAWKFVKTLWDGSKKRCVAIERLERKVWDDKFVKRHTMVVFVIRLRETLKKAGFPYKIITVKNFSTHEISGFRMKVT